jgi:hypothetical protein
MESAMFEGAVRVDELMFTGNLWGVYIQFFIGLLFVIPLTVIVEVMRTKSPNPDST